jgi:hypothetical protein
MKVKELLIAILMIGAVAVLVNVSQGAPKRPIQMPVTLLDLYRNSDAVFEGRFDRVEEGDIIRQDQDYLVVKVKKLFDISSTLKGSHFKFVSLSEDEYRYPAPPPSPNYLLAKAGSEEEQTYGLRSGDSVLLFLKYGEDGKTLELTNPEDGLKKLSSNDIAVYEKRIRELDGLLSGDEPSASAIAEWMIRCAEEPATRWEATFELVKGFERLDYQRKQKHADPEVKTLVAEKTDFFDSTTFAKAVTDEQKRKLADILLDRPQPQVGEDGQAKGTYIRGDRELIDLVKQWGDPRLAGFLLNELKTREFTDYRRSETMQLIADLLGDPRIMGVAQKYNASYRNHGLAEQLFDSQGDSVNPATNYQQARTALMAKFIKLASSVIE